MLKKICCLLSLFLVFTLDSFSQQFKVAYSPASLNQPFTGKVFLYLSKNNPEPLTVSIGIEPLNCFAVDVKGIKPGESIVIDDRATAYPVLPSEMERGTYYVQAVWDLNLGGRAIATSPGNIFSRSQKIVIGKDLKQSFTLLADQVVPEPVFQETEFVKEFKAPSRLLSDFHQKKFTLDAAVQLPADYYKNPSAKFPVLFVVTGFGADHHYMSVQGKLPSVVGTTPVIRVFLDGNCDLGHSGYANSDNNGPWGDALTQEFIPLLEKKYRCNGARMLTGHSSGGWSVLWLQTHYPKLFLATASSSPDYVDFRKFLNVNLYTKDSNLFYDANGHLNPGGTVAGRFPFSYLKEMYQVENVISRGEQQRSFEAVFSKKGNDGLPELICDPQTGLINQGTVENWKKYDISLYLRDNWKDLSKDLSGKIRISIGDDDNFMLNYPVRLMNEEMKAVQADMLFKYYPGDHFTVKTVGYMADLSGFLEEKYKQWLLQTSK